MGFSAHQIGHRDVIERDEGVIKLCQIIRAKGHGSSSILGKVMVQILFNPRAAEFLVECEHTGVFRSLQSLITCS